MVGANPIAVLKRHMRGRRSTIMFVDEPVIVMV
jgi:hypothetical protein